jgi:subtilisin family serine protease
MRERGFMKRGIPLLVLGFCLGSCGRAPKNDGSINKLKAARETLNTYTVLGEDWFNLNPEEDFREGESINRLYRELSSFKPLHTLTPITVAVIDSGVDISHEDLKNNLWKNAGELGLDENGHDKATNGIDDDNNGYIDDVYGWNFIGGYDQSGKPVHISAETLEKTRLLRKFTQKLNVGEKLSEEENLLYTNLKSEIENERTQAQEDLNSLNSGLLDIEKNYPPLEVYFKKSVELLTRADLVSLESTNEEILKARDQILSIFDGLGFPSVFKIKQFIEINQDTLNYSLNVDFDPRSSIVKDNPDDFNDIHYGNNDVSGVENDHGTHVAGIIAAQRSNDIGIKGVASHARIMSLRAIPNGDERDKDIALSIRYAANMGARIINMSFGKQYSPDREKVQQAIEYAEQKGVLFIHAAGNEAKNLDLYKNQNFPTPLKIKNSEKISAWIEVGASSGTKGLALPAIFSNYGQTSVDIFAPGVRIESCVPGNKYAVFSGTSMASPALAGVAALLWSIKPELTAIEVRDLILNKGRSYEDLVVKKPSQIGPLAQVLFSELSITGKIVDAFESFKELIQ